MQPVAGKAERLRRCGPIQTAKNVLHGFQQVRAYFAAIIAFIEPFQAAVLEAPDRQDTVKQRLPFCQALLYSPREPVRENYGSGGRREANSPHRGGNSDFLESREHRSDLRYGFGDGR